MKSSIPIDKILSSSFMVVDSSMQVNQLVSLISKQKPEYVIISRLYGLLYALKSSVFIHAVKSKTFNENATIQEFLDLHEDDRSERIEVSSSDPSSISRELGKFYSKNISVRQDYQPIVIKKNLIVGIVDPQRLEAAANYVLPRINLRYSPMESIKESMESPREIEYEVRRGEVPPQTTASEPELEPLMTELPTDEQRNVTVPPLTDKQKISRYPSAAFPEQIGLGQTGDLDVSITIEKILAGEVKPLNIEIPQNSANEIPVTVIVSCSPTDSLEFVGGKQIDEIKVPVKENDSTHASFQLKGIKVGPSQIKIEFYQGSFLGSLEIGTEIVVAIDPRAQIGTAKVSSRNLLIRQEPSPDLSLLITQSGQNSFDVRITSQILKCVYKCVSKIQFQGSPKEIFESVFQAIEQSDPRKVPSEAIERHIASQGRDLYKQLFTGDLHTIFWANRKNIKSIQVVSEDPWVPWEILKPWDYTSPAAQEDDFLCQNYAFSRWYSKNDIVTKERFENVKMVVPNGTNLGGAVLESRFLEDYQHKAGFKFSLDSTFQQVFDSLANGGFDILHISTHGSYQRNNPQQSAIQLDSGVTLQPSYISGEKIYSAFTKSNPLIILNACQTSQQGFSLTGIGGWAASFLDAHASAFIGTLWSIRDITALSFTKALYPKLSAGMELDEAVKQARNEARQNGDPSWLAYTLYAQPKVRVKLGHN